MPAHAWITCFWNANLIGILRQPYEKVTHTQDVLMLGAECGWADEGMGNRRALPMRRRWSRKEAQEMGSRWVSFLGMLSQISGSSVAYKNSNPFSRVSEDRRLHHMCVVWAVILGWGEPLVSFLSASDHIRYSLACGYRTLISASAQPRCSHSSLTRTLRLRTK